MRPVLQLKKAIFPVVVWRSFTLQRHWAPLRLKGDQSAGVQIVAEAIREPLRQIVRNAGGEAGVVIQNILDNSDSNHGFDADRGAYGDMVDMKNHRPHQGDSKCTSKCRLSGQHDVDHRSNDRQINREDES